MKRFIRVVRLALLLPVFLAPAGFGQILPVPLAVSPEVRDFFSSFRGGSRSNVATLPDGGGFATVWNRQSFDLRSSDVYLQFVRPDGTLVFERPGRAVAAFAAWETDAVVAAHAREGALVAWRVYRSRQLNSSQMMFQWVDGQGRSRWKAGVAAAPEDEIPDASSLHSLVSGPDGGVFVGVYAASQAGVTFHRFTADGTSLWPADGVPVVDPSTVSPGDVNWLTYAVFDGNGLRFAWQHLPGDSTPSELRFGALDLAGNRLMGPAGATLTEPGFHELGGLAFDPESGVSFVIWHSLRTVREVGDADALGAIYTSP